MLLTQDELLAEIEADWPEPGEFVYIERRGDSYMLSRASFDVVVAGPEPDAPLPDAWIYYSGWQEHHRHNLSAFFDDLLAEMEAAAGGHDRCRWSVDDPWPHSH
ncbi:MAG: hypothetical protein ACRDRM_04020 [Pseudonocardiaceae bacterium]